MQITKELLDKLGYLHLKLYAGLERDRSIEWTFDSALMNRPVQIETITPRAECNDTLFQIVREAETEGKYTDFDCMKARINTGLASIAKQPPFARLSVLPNGIFVGEPEDLLAFLEGRRTDIMYYEKGLGNKLAKILFEDVKIV